MFARKTVLYCKKVNKNNKTTSANGTDGQTDGQTDRQTECDAICGPLLKEEGRIIIVDTDALLRISRFLSSTCTEVSGVKNIGQCGRLSQLSWLFGGL